MMRVNDTGLNSSSNVELELMLEFIKCLPFVDYTMPKNSDIYPKVPYSNYLKTFSTPACCEAAAIGRSLAKKAKVEKQKFWIQEDFHFSADTSVYFLRDFNRIPPL